ncbi:sugar phosphate nucleotidyltransferase [Candidatus Omnitrophota bacterium]
MKGVILAGGLGKRLDPLTRITNKHLLPVYNKPMIHYPLMSLVEAGIKDIMIVTGGNNAGDFLRLLGNGNDFGLKHINYTYQKGEGGIAEALKLAEDFIDKEKVAVILGDNLFGASIKRYVDAFRKQARGARIFIKEVEHPEKFGAVEIKAGKIVSIEEKPKKPRSNYVGTGLYMYDHKVFDFIKTLKPSWRNELEITDVNNMYLKRKELEFDIVKGFWSDCGAFSSLLRANNFIAKRSKETP